MCISKDRMYNYADEMVRHQGTHVYLIGVILYNAVPGDQKGLNHHYTRTTNMDSHMTNGLQKRRPHEKLPANWK